MASYSANLMRRAGVPLLTRLHAERGDTGELSQATIQPLGGGAEILTTYIVTPAAVEERIDQFGDRETKKTHAEKTVHFSMMPGLDRIEKNWGVRLGSESWTVEAVQSVNHSWVVAVLRKVSNRVNRTPRA